MLRLNSGINSKSDLKSSIRLLNNVIASLILFMPFTSMVAFANNQTSLPISRSEAANPANFKHLNINGRAVTSASEPCPIEKGAITCGIEKLKLITGSISEVDADYDLAQVFYYPSKAQHRTAVVVISRSGLMDDSISAERYRISFKLEGSSSDLHWNWVQYGVQYQCMRGNKGGKWTKNLCS